MRARVCRSGAVLVVNGFSAIGRCAALSGLLAAQALGCSGGGDAAPSENAAPSAAAGPTSANPPASNSSSPPAAALDGGAAVPGGASVVTYTEVYKEVIEGCGASFC